MQADGAYAGSLLANDDVSTVAALPDGVSIAAEHDTVFDVLQQLTVALLMVLLDGSHTAKLERFP